MSQLKLYEQCPLRYRFYYIERLRPTYQLVESFVGARVHESMEYLYVHLKNQDLRPVADVIQFYSRRWEQMWSSTVQIVNQRRNREWYRRYGEKCLRRYYVQHYPFLEPGIHMIEVEWPFQIVLGPEGRYRMRGHVDRLTRRDDNSYVVHDYKTSQYVPRKGMLARDLQPGVYQLAVRETFPEARKVSVSWHYLASQQEIRPTLSANQLDRLRTKLVRRIDKIEQDQEFSPRPTKYCRNCEYKQICPAQNDITSRTTSRAKSVEHGRLSQSPMTQPSDVDAIQDSSSALSWEKEVGDSAKEKHHVAEKKFSS